MKESEKILLVISEYLKDNPKIRFGQALFNLGINEFADKKNPEAKGFLLRDIHSDSDSKIVERMVKAVNNWTSLNK